MSELPFFSRRAFLRQASLGFGSMALTYLLHGDSVRAAESGVDLQPRSGHFRAKAKSVILLFQNGGPSQVDLFDPKPELQKRDGQKYAQKFESFQPGSETNVLMASPLKFRRHGQCGMDFSELLPSLGSVADELCMVRSMFSDNNNHPQAMRCLNTGKIFSGRPTLGAWVGYALGTVNQNLPAYVVLRDPAGYNTTGKLVWSSGWLPALYQGTELSATGTPVLNLKPSKPLPAGAREDSLDFLGKLNEAHARRFPQESDLEARIRNFELAARMQLKAADVLDLKKETTATRKLYGLDNPTTAGYGLRCLLARRLVEAGVRFVQVFPPPF